MKRLAILLGIILLPASVAAATLSWDYDSDYDRVDGYTVYFSDGENDYNYTFPQSEVTVDETNGKVSWGPIEENLNLHYGVEYTITLQRYNDAQASVESNSVTYTRPTYSPPTDQLPDPVTSEPSGPEGMGVE